MAQICGQLPACEYPRHLFQRPGRLLPGCRAGRRPTRRSQGETQEERKESARSTGSRREAFTEQRDNYGQSRTAVVGRGRGTSEGEGPHPGPAAQKAPGHATTPAGGESGGRPHGRLGGGGAGPG
ncbi:hypothetical protein T261_3792 [Streptomyces lydicus]|nr:hypothetical protein T261_3792 [Streptomyces lydicus]